MTGASLGIGRALSLNLAGKGWTVIATARRPDDLQTLALAAQNLPGRIHVAQGDVTDSGRMSAIVDEVETALGPIDLAVFNAGLSLPVRGDCFDIENVRTLIDVNVMGVAHGLHAVLPRMVQRQRGRVALMSSLAGYGGLPSAAVYGATKAALINLAAGLKFDLDRHGVVTQVICPGFVETPLTDKNAFPMPFLISAEDAAERIVKGLATNRFEIAFPRRFAFMLKALNLLPYRLYFALISRGSEWRKEG